MGKKTNWTAAEDQALCRAWLHASEAPLPAPEQRAATFWASVHHLFHSEMSTTVERPLNGLKIRWTRINRDVQKFAVAHAQVLAAHGRGDGDAVVLDAEGEAPLIDEAKARFEKERGTKFLFESCWKLLRFSPKWMHNLASNMGVSSASAAVAAAASSSAVASANGAPADTEFLAQDRASRIDDPSVAIAADAFRVATSLAGANKRRAPTFLDVLPQEPLEHLSGLTGALVEELRRRNELLEEQNALALFRLDADLAQHDDAQAYFGMLRQRYLKKMRLAVAMEGSTDVHSSVANLHHSSSTTSATASAADEEAKTTDLGDHELRVV